MRLGKRSEVLNRTKTNGIIGESVQKLLYKLNKISNHTIKQNDFFEVSTIAGSKNEVWVGTGNDLILWGRY